MAKHCEGLELEIVKAVNCGKIIEPITVSKVSNFCKNNNLDPSESHINVVLANSTENTRNQSYNKYFIRVGKGEYVISPEFRKKINYYWLNINTIQYEWAFSERKIGQNETYSNKNEDGGNRQKQSCFKSIKVGDLAVAYETGEAKAITSICKVIDKYTVDDEIIVDFKKIMGFENYLHLDKMRNIRELSDCKTIEFHIGTLFDLSKRHFDQIKDVLERMNNQDDYFLKLEQQVKESRSLSREERQERLLNNKNRIPEKVTRVVNDFSRNPDVIAEVLERANGICESCLKPAPFMRASNGTPYLEIHHKIRLADGGEDTVENAIAVCPNCHKKYHFG